MPITVLMSVISIHVEKVSAFYLSLLLQRKCKHNAIQILLSINQNLKKKYEKLVKLCTCPCTHRRRLCLVSYCDQWRCARCPTFYKTNRNSRPYLTHSARPNVHRVPKK